MANMTLVSAWNRQAGKSDELVIVSDSRLTGGIEWDCGPKVFPLSRGDAVLAFAGQSYYAYPLIMQVIHWSEDFFKARNRAMDLCDMKGHIERTCTKLLQEIDLSGIRPPAKLEEDFKLVLGGFSWEWGKFYIWVSRIDAKRRLTFAKPHPAPHGVAFVGDRTAEARKLLSLAVGRSRRRRVDWEPLDVLVKMIKDPTARSIGGPPQIVKVYRHLNTMMYAVPWDFGRDERVLTLRGRPLLDYEQTQRLIHDPETHEQQETWRYVRTSSTAPTEQLDATRRTLLSVLQTRKDSLS